MALLAASGSPKDRFWDGTACLGHGTVARNSVMKRDRPNMPVTCFVVDLT